MNNFFLSPSNKDSKSATFKTLKVFIYVTISWNQYEFPIPNSEILEPFKNFLSKQIT